MGKVSERCIGCRIEENFIRERFIGRNWFLEGKKCFFECFDWVVKIINCCLNDWNL